MDERLTQDYTFTTLPCIAGVVDQDAPSEYSAALVLDMLHIQL